MFSIHIRTMRDSLRFYSVLRNYESFWIVLGFSVGLVCCARESKKWTLYDLTASRFPHKVSNYKYLHPCKADGFMGDIALSLLEKDVYEKELEEGDLREQELSKLLAERAKNVTELDIKRRYMTTKQDRNESRSRNRKRYSGKNRRKRSTQAHGRSKRGATALPELLWDNAVIPYEIESTFSGEQEVLFLQAMRHWENYTCIQFVERADHPDYIVFTEESCGCCSFVGKKRRGPQGVSIGDDCDTLHIVLHELGHVIGFWHEHVRPDRDEYVAIIFQNIIAGREKNFRKLTEKEVNSLGFPYDYASVMHYARDTFSRNIYDTIVPYKDPQGKRPDIERKDRLSEGDISQTNRLYKCPKCGKTLQNPSGDFSSPDYGSSSPSDALHCEWRITASQGERIILYVTDIDIFKYDNCETDYLEVRDGYWYKSPLLGKFCKDRKVSGVLISSKSRMLVTYRTSQNTVIRTGFKAHYNVVCSGDIVQEKGILQSPNYPGKYPPNTVCTWRITVPENHQVALRFHSIKIEHKDNCSSDYLEIQDGHENKSPLLGRFCGYKNPKDIQSSGNKMTVKFVSDESDQEAGFAVDFITEIDECKGDHGCEHECINTIGSYKCACRIGYELHYDGRSCEGRCGGVIEETNGTITSPSFPELYPSSKTCIWKIIVPPQYKIFLNFTHFDLEDEEDCDFDNVVITSKMANDDIWMHGVFCGPRLPPLIESEDNSLQIEFRSDNSVQKSGFAAIFFTDKDECATNNGGCQHICNNTIGSYVCSCHNGSVLKENLHDCVDGNFNVPCGGVIKENNGTITSPSFPDRYPPNKICIWEILAPPQYRITLDFTDFDLEEYNQQECSYDSVNITSKLTDHEIMKYGVFCGSRLPPRIASKSNSLRIEFRSDNSIQKYGFLASFFTDTCNCELEETATSECARCDLERPSFENDFSLFATAAHLRPFESLIRLAFIAFFLHILPWQ